MLLLQKMAMYCFIKGGWASASASALLWLSKSSQPTMITMHIRTRKVLGNILLDGRFII